MKKANKPRIQHLRNGDRREFLNSRPLWATQSYTENLGGRGWGETKWLRIRICGTNTHVTEFSPQHC